MQHFSKEDIKKLEEYLGVQQGAQIYEKNLWKKVYFWLPFLRCIP